jgi:hypothetical protein
MSNHRNWVDSNIDTESWDEKSRTYQALRREWTGKSEEEARQAFLNNGYTVNTITWEQCERYSRTQPYFHNLVTLFLKEGNELVDHICDG